MNYLAHCCLVPPTPEALAGALLGDLVHGPDLSALPDEVARSVRLHRAIDRYTDNHADVIACKNTLQAPLRRYAGIIVDVAFDHLLARNLSHWYPSPLATISQQVYDAIARYRHLAPAGTVARLDYISREHLLERYVDERSIGKALTGIGTRFQRDNPLHEAGAAVQPLLTAWNRRFELFYPQLQAFARTTWQQLATDPSQRS